MDPRFLLYLLPFWAIYAAFAIENFGILSKLSLRDKTPFQMILIGISVYFCLSMSAIQLHAFDSNSLPLTPQMTLRFSQKAVSRFNIPLITTDSILTEYDNNDYNPMAVFPFFSNHRTFRLSELNVQFGDDAKTVGTKVRKLISSGEGVGVVGDLFSNYVSRMRLFNTVERNIVICEPVNVRYCIAATKKWLHSPKWNPIFVGKVLTLLERTP